MNTYPARYRPLCHYLAQRPAAQQTVRLSFAELAALVGHDLPRRAGQSHYWSSRGVARALRQQGWQAWLDQPTVVLFVRLPDTPPV